MSDFEVYLTDGIDSVTLTPYVSNLSFRSVDPGGFGSVTFDLARSVDAASFPFGAEVSVFDSETGEQVAGGRMLNPGRGVSSSGEVWNVSVLGEGLAHTQERKQPYILIDSRLEPWYSGASTSIDRKWDVGTAPDDENQPGLRFTINQTSVGIGAFTNANYYTFGEYEPEAVDETVHIGGYSITHREGRTDSSSRLETQIRYLGTITDLSDQGFSSSVRTVSKQIGTNWPTTDRIRNMNLVFVRQSSILTVVPDDDWIIVYDIHVSAVRKDRNGDDLHTAGIYTRNHVFAHEAIIDAFARYCPRFDLIHARIDTSTFQHKQLVWPDGINTFELLDHLMSLEPAYTWAVWEKQTNGKYRVEWRAKDTDVRYEIGSEDGFSVTGGENDRLARVWYTGDTTLGRYQAIDVDDPSQFSPVIRVDNIYPTDTRQISLSNIEGSDWESAAEDKAEAAIEDSKFKATAAQVTVAQLVYDHRLGRWVKPYQVLPGYLCRVAGVRSNLDTLNEREVDGAAVFRIVSNDYSVDQGSSRLELNSYTVDESRAIANLLNAVPTA